jgi:type III restriction enzyme
MGKKKNKAPIAQTSFLENYGKTAPAVPAISAEVNEWRANNYKGATATSRALLNHWFKTDHRTQAGPFRYYDAQRVAVETLIYVYEVAKTRSLSDLYQRFIPATLAGLVRLPPTDPFARYCVKMATGSGKTKVMSLAVAWQYFNSVAENNPHYARSFLVIAPNVIVFERLKTDFGGGLIFKTDPIIPKELQIFWDMQFYMRGEAERASSMGALYLTNIQQLYDSRKESDSDEPEIMTAVLGSKPPANLSEGVDFRDRILARTDSPVMVLNDEAHHTHDPESEWNQSIQSLAESHPSGLTAQLDFSATPRYQSGALFPWTISDYTLKQALIDRIVKRPVKGITDIGEAPSQVPHVRYAPFITAAIERWREYRDALAKMSKKPLLFIMLNSTDEADAIAEYLQVKYPDEFGGAKTLVIHTKQNGEISEKDLDKARVAAREVDRDDSPVNAIVSVLMLREGWDVRNVTVIVGLRPYTSKANILPEQTIGRGLRLMFRGSGVTLFKDSPQNYTERVDIIGNPGFIKFVEQLEKEEDVQLDTWQVGKDKLVITVIEPDMEKLDYDITVPTLSPILARASSLQEAIESIDIASIKCPPLPRVGDKETESKFHYEGRDILTLEKLFDRDYVIPTPRTSQEIVSYYAQVIAQELKLPSQFAYLAPKVRDFLKYRAFGAEVDLDAPDILPALGKRLTMFVTKDVFIKLLKDKITLPQIPTLESPGRKISTLAAFPWSQAAPVCRKTVLNKVPCDSGFERDFAKFLDNASDVAAFTKLPIQFNFMIPYTDSAGNLRHYYPDFVVVDTGGVHHLVETKGREDTEVPYKDRSARLWVENATRLTGVTWQYSKILQHDFLSVQPTSFADIPYLGQTQPNLFDNVEQ